MEARPKSRALASADLEVDEYTFDDSPPATVRSLSTTTSSGTIPFEGAQQTSKNGTSITSEIITEIMPYMDAYGFPFLHVDGHGSTFVVDSLADMNSESRKGFVSIGVPYETSLWQVTDSTFKSIAAKKNNHLGDISNFKEKEEAIAATIESDDDAKEEPASNNAAGDDETNNRHRKALTIREDEMNNNHEIQQPPLQEMMIE